MGIFDAIGIDAGIVLIIVILIQLVLIFFLVKQSMKLARLTNKYKMFMRGKMRYPWKKHLKRNSKK